MMDNYDKFNPLRIDGHLEGLDYQKNYGNMGSLTQEGQKQLYNAVSQAIINSLGININKRSEENIHYVHRFANAFSTEGSRAESENYTKVIYPSILQKMEDNMYRKPLALIGDPGVGKNVLISQFIQKNFVDGRDYRITIDFYEDIGFEEVTHSYGVTSENYLVGKIEEAIIKANKLWRDAHNGEMVHTDYSDEQKVFVELNEFTRCDGSAYRALYEFWAGKFNEYWIGDKIYYNTPNLIFILNGNTSVNGMHIGLSTFHDEALKSRCCWQIVNLLSGTTSEAEENVRAYKDYLDSKYREREILPKVYAKLNELLTDYKKDTEKDKNKKDNGKENKDYSIKLRDWKTNIEENNDEAFKLRDDTYEK